MTLTTKQLVQFAMYQNMLSFRIFGDLENYTFCETLGPSVTEKQCLHFFSQASYGRHLGFSKWRLVSIRPSSDGAYQIMALSVRCPPEFVQAITPDPHDFDPRL
jgi:catechol-2,3-dioxygenase